MVSQWVSDRWSVDSIKRSVIHIKRSVIKEVSITCFCKFLFGFQLIPDILSQTFDEVKIISLPLDNPSMCFGKEVSETIKYLSETKISTLKIRIKISEKLKSIEIYKILIFQSVFRNFLNSSFHLY